MVSRSHKHRLKRLSEGSREITLMLSPEGIAELDRRRSATGKSRIQLVEDWLLGDRSVLEK